MTDLTPPRALIEQVTEAANIVTAWCVSSGCEPTPINEMLILARFVRTHLTPVLKEPPMDDAQVKHMVNRFLGWRLPDSFSPDGGIGFAPEFNVEYMASQGKPPMRSTPTGTNLFDADQAEQMVRHMLEGWPAQEPADFCGINQMDEEHTRVDQPEFVVEAVDLLGDALFNFSASVRDLGLLNNEIGRARYEKVVSAYQVLEAAIAATDTANAERIAELEGEVAALKEDIEHLHQDAAGASL